VKERSQPTYLPLVCLIIGITIVLHCSRDQFLGFVALTGRRSWVWSCGIIAQLHLGYIQCPCPTYAAKLQRFCSIRRDENLSRKAGDFPSAEQQWHDFTRWNHVAMYKSTSILCNHMVNDGIALFGIHAECLWRVFFSYLWNGERGSSYCLLLCTTDNICDSRVRCGFPSPGF